MFKRILIILFMFVIILQAADKKITDLNAITNSNLDASDIFPIVDVSETETKKIRLFEVDNRYIRKDTTNNVAHLDSNNLFTENQIINGDSLIITNASGADSITIFDDGDTTRIESNNNPIKIGKHSLVVKENGDIFVNGRSFVKAINHGYAGFQDSSRAVIINTVNVWEHITNSNNDLYTELENDSICIVNDTIHFHNTGDYTGMISVTISGLNGKDYQLRAYNITQDKEMGFHIGNTTSGAGNYANISMPLYFEVAADDKVIFQIRCTTDSSDPTFRSSIYTIIYIHE